jgi:hypothetical protein
LGRLFFFDGSPFFTEYAEMLILSQEKALHGSRLPV